MRPRRTSVRLAVSAALVASVLVSAGCDLVDETTSSTSSTPAAKVERRFEGRTLLQVQPAQATSITASSCRPAATVACSIDAGTTYELLGGPSRVSLVNARVLRAADGTWGVQARFARESEPTLTAARARAVTDATALVLVGNGNVALLVVPTVDAPRRDRRLVVTSGGTEQDALAVIATLGNGS